MVNSQLGPRSHPGDWKTSWMMVCSDEVEDRRSSSAGKRIKMTGAENVTEGWRPGG